MVSEFCCRFCQATAVVLGLVLLGIVSRTAVAEDPLGIDFSDQIRPILSDRCFACHGPDEQHRAAGLRLDLAESVLGKAESGNLAIVPGKPAESELVRRIKSHDEFEQMPPPDSNKKLKAEEIALIEQWVREGAPYEEHWAFRSPQKSEPPKVNFPDWNERPIDRFLGARLKAEGLVASPAADKRTLIRRVTFDLTGLPPSREEVEQFLEDDSPDAYEKVVDRLLASPRYGEHMARFWLDAARYGDTHGLHLDNYREMWLYRDWVVGAFNSNKPYDQFIVEQLAGDLLPNPSWEQRVATGFNRCNVTTSEGGSIAAEVKMRNVVDRVVTTGTVFMGLTMDCTRCHDHKYDPLTMTDFYSMYAFFNSIDGNPLDGNKKDHAPVVYTEKAEEELAHLEGTLKETRELLKAELAKIEYQDPGLETEEPESKPEEVVWLDDAIPGQANSTDNWQWVTAPEPVFSGEKSAKRSATGNQQHYFNNSDQPLTVFEGDIFFGYVYLDPANLPKEIMFQWNDGNWDHRAYWGENLIEYGQEGKSRIRFGDLPEAGKWVRLEVSAAKVGLAPGTKVNGWAFTQFDGTVYWDKAGVVTRHGKPRHFHSLQNWMEFAQKSSAPTTPENKAIDTILKKSADKRNAAEQKQLREYFLEFVCVDTRAIFDPLHETLAKAEARRKEIHDTTPTTLVFNEKATPEKAHILNRGEYDQVGEEVTRAVPSFLPPLTEEMPKNRLGLALWMIDPSHPLTARVAVNRLWQQVFGTGLVKTSEDFGAQGSVPSHPKLLDNLAVEFRESGWDIKQLMKRLVMTAAYRQDSKLTPALVAKDPENRLLARGPRYRLDAEMLRDQALFLSGLLVEKMGGPSVKPPQPEGLWEAVGYTRSNTANFEADEGPDKVHRRSLYTFIKRTAPPPRMSTFDAPSREACTVRRERTNTPMQALLLLNDPQYLEAAIALAKRAIAEGGSDPKSRIEYLIALCHLNPENKTQREELEKLYFDSLSHFQTQPEAAAKLVGKSETPEEWAAWTIVANTILNLDALVTKN